MKKTGPSEAPRVFYAAGCIRTEMEVESNLPFRVPALKLQWADGQVGALPVFSTREEAERWSDGAPVIRLEEATDDRTE